MKAIILIIVILSTVGCSSGAPTLGAMDKYKQDVLVDNCIANARTVLYQTTQVLCESAFNRTPGRVLWVFPRDTIK